MKAKEEKRTSNNSDCYRQEIGFQFSSTEDMEWDPAMA